MYMDGMLELCATDIRPVCLAVCLFPEMPLVGQADLGPLWLRAAGLSLGCHYWDECQQGEEEEEREN